MTDDTRDPGATPPVGSDCFSDQLLDDHLAGKGLSEAQTDHLRSCERCRSRLALFEADREAAAPTVARLVARAEAQHAERRPLALRPLFWGGLAAVAAVMLLVIARPLDEPATDLRFKGAGLRFVVQRAGQVQPGVSGAAFRAGDALRFVVTLDAPAQVLLVGIEADGKVSVYFPADGDHSAALPAGADQALPGSIVLDDARATERFVGLFSAEPLTRAQIETAVHAALARGEPLTHLDELPETTTQHWVVIRKE